MKTLQVGVFHVLIYFISCRFDWNDKALSFLILQNQREKMHIFVTISQNLITGVKNWIVENKIQVPECTRDTIMIFENHTKFNK